MQTQLAKLIDEMQRHAKVCQTVAEDMTQESLTGASCEKEKNVQAAKEWMMKSQVWLEAEALVRECLSPSAPAARGPALPPPDATSCI